MHPIRTTKRHFLSLASIALALTACGDSLPNREPIAPLIAGLGDQVLLARDRGMVLLGELNCVGCHQATGGIAVLHAAAPSSPPSATACDRIFCGIFLLTRMQPTQARRCLQCCLIAAPRRARQQSAPCPTICARSQTTHHPSLNRMMRTQQHAAKRCSTKSAASPATRRAMSKATNGRCQIHCHSAT